MEKGVIKFFKQDKGYGFIKRESGADVFVHIKDFVKFDPRYPNEFYPDDGAEVEFNIVQNDKGQDTAKSVVVL